MSGSSRFPRLRTGIERVHYSGSEPAVLANKVALEDFKAGRFERYIKSLELTALQETLLRYLAGEQSLPLAAISVAMDRAPEEVGPAIASLIDWSLATLAGNNYSISAPIRTAVSRSLGILLPELYREIANRLKDAYWSDDEFADIDVIDATLRAMAVGGVAQDGVTQDAIRSRVSTIQRIAEQSYHRRDYDTALSYARQAQRLDPKRRSLSETIYKSLVRKERWSEAEKELEQIRRSGDLKYHFLRGFGLRLQRKFAEAEAEFASALLVGDNSVQVHRERAFCLFALGKYDESLRECRSALRRTQGSAFLLDLEAKVCIVQGNYKDAAKAIASLAAVDSEERFIHHRRATYSMKLKDMESALSHANLAVAQPGAPFEAFAQRVNILIELGVDADIQTATNELLKRFPREEHDVKLGLQCKGLTRQGHWREGLEIWGQLRSKRRPVHQALLKAIYVAKTQDQSLSLVQRKEAQAMADGIGANLDVLADLSELLSLPDSN